MSDEENEEGVQVDTTPAFTDDPTSEPVHTPEEMIIMATFRTIRSFDFNENQWKLAAKPFDYLFIKLPIIAFGNVHTDHPTIKVKHLAKGIVSRQREFALLKDAELEMHSMDSDVTTANSSLQWCQPKILNIDVTKGLSVKKTKNPVTPGQGHALVKNGNDVVPLFGPTGKIPKAGSVLPKYFTAHFGCLSYKQQPPIQEIIKRVLFYSNAGTSHTVQNSEGVAVPCKGTQLCESISHPNDAHMAHLCKMYNAKGCSFPNRFQWTTAMKDAVDGTTANKSLDPSEAINKLERTRASLAGEGKSLHASHVINAGKLMDTVALKVENARKYANASGSTGAHQTEAAEKCISSMLVHFELADYLDQRNKFKTLLCDVTKISTEALRGLVHGLQNITFKSEMSFREYLAEYYYPRNQKERKSEQNVFEFDAVTKLFQQVQPHVKEFISYDEIITDLEDTTNPMHPSGQKQRISKMFGKTFNGLPATISIPTSTISIPTEATVEPCLTQIELMKLMLQHPEIMQYRNSLSTSKSQEKDNNSSNERRHKKRHAKHGHDDKASSSSNRSLLKNNTFDDTSNKKTCFDDSLFDKRQEEDRRYGYGDSQLDDHHHHHHHHHHHQDRHFDDRHVEDRRIDDRRVDDRRFDDRRVDDRRFNDRRVDDRRFDDRRVDDRRFHNRR